MPVQEPETADPAPDHEATAWRVLQPISRARARKPRARDPRHLPTPAVGRRWQRRGRRRLCPARTRGETVAPNARPISDTSVSKQIQSNSSPYLN